MLLLGLILALGVMACTPNEHPAATSAGFVQPEGSTTPSKIPLSPTPTKTATPTDTRVPKDTPTIPSPPPPTSTPTVTPLACLSEPGAVESRQLDSQSLPKPLEYLVYLPPCYAQSAQRYPVIYLIHGQTYRADHWLDLGAGEIADRLITAGEVAPFIMVFPYERDHYIYPPENEFRSAFINNLIPAVDGEYRTLRDRSQRAIGGISRGGNWAVHIGLQHPKLFGAIGAHSTPVFSSDSNPEIIRWLRAIPLDEMPRIYLDAGENDRWLQYTQVFEQILNDENIPHEWHLYPGFHEDAYWQAHMEEYLRWYAQGW